MGRPLVDTVEHSRFPNMKELRPASPGRSEIRILFAFDPVRRAIMLLAGDKSAGEGAEGGGNGTGGPSPKPTGSMRPTWKGWVRSDGAII